MSPRTRNDAGPKSGSGKLTRTRASPAGSDYRLSRRKQMIQEYFDTSEEVDWEPRHNIALSQRVGIIRQDPTAPERHFLLACWGLIPFWAKDTSIG